MRLLARAAAVTTALILAACGSDRPTAPRASVETAPLHIHGLGVNPADSALYVATHDGLYSAPADGRQLALVGDSRRDTMGFSVIGPDRFLASGHPAPDEPGPVLQGLIRSHDAGRSWTPGPLKGSGDLHVIRPGSRAFYAHDAHENRLFVGALTGSGLAGRAVPAGTLIDLAVDPENDDSLYATTDRGFFFSDDGAREWQQISRRRTGLLAFDRGQLIMIAADRSVSALRRIGVPWKQVGILPAGPAALAPGAPGELLAATEEGAVYRSTDGGATWDKRIGPTLPAERS